MITDQKATGVPSGNAFSTQGLSRRTQLITPTQALNAGSTAAKAANVPSPRNYLLNNQPSKAVTNSVDRTIDAKSNPYNIPFASGYERPTYSSLGSEMARAADRAAAREDGLSFFGETAENNRATAPYGSSFGVKDVNGDYVYESNFLGGNNVKATISNYDKARQAIGYLSDQEILKLLDEIANDTIKNTPGDYDFSGDEAVGEKTLVYNNR